MHLLAANITIRGTPADVRFAQALRTRLCDARNNRAASFPAARIVAVKQFRPVFPAVAPSDPAPPSPQPPSIPEQV